MYYNKSSPVAFSGKSSVVRELFVRLKNKNVHFKTKKQVLELVDDWFRNESSYTLHKSARKKVKRTPVVVKGVYSQFQMDLVDMQYLAKENKGYNYILTIIDVFSKRAWALPLKDKGGLQVRHSLEKFFESLEKLPRNVQSDRGKEFTNKHVQSLFNMHKINFFTTKNQETKAQIVERFNRTLQGRMYRLFTRKGNNRWIDHLQDLVNGYNKTYHSKIGMKPIDVTPADELKIIAHMNCKKPIRLPKRKALKPGQYVLISKSSRLFQKGYLPQWSDEVFKIHKVVNTRPHTYEIQDMEGNIIEGRFFEEELQLLPLRSFKGKRWIPKKV